jgi:transcriptional regulator with XRE-family HTH domain
MTPTEGELEQNPVQAEPWAPEPGPPQGPQAPDPGPPQAPQTLAERIRAVRGAWKWSQGEMADALRVDQASISFWERGKVRPSGSALVAMAALFRTTVDALERGEGFIMPSLPGGGAAPKGLRAPPRAVCLPVAGPDGVTVIDLAAGDLMARPPAEAAMDLDRYAKDGRRLWIVVE